MFEKIEDEYDNTVADEAYIDCAYLAQVADDVRVGRVQNADEVFDEILGELNKADHER